MQVYMHTLFVYTLKYLTLLLFKMKTKSKVLSNKKKQKRNERERNRIKCLNSVYEKLKKHVPDDAKFKKISKFNLITYIYRAKK